LVVALLALVLLAGLIPPGALSAAHACRMECCAGKPSHEAGACSAALPSAAPDKTAQETKADEHAAHHGEMQMSVTVDETEADASSDHDPTTDDSATQLQAPRPTPSRQSSVAAHAFTRPCSAECAAAVLSLSQVRRPREAAALSHIIRPRPPTLVTRADAIDSLLPSSAERRRQSRPRAPPVNPSA
jgi:hypothetical protein